MPIATLLADFVCGEIIRLVEVCLPTLADAPEHTVR